MESRGNSKQGRSMTDSIAQDLLTDRPVFINGTLSVADGEQTPPAIGDTGAPDEATYNDGGELARSPAILSRLAVDLERAGLAGELARRRSFIWQ